VSKIENPVLGTLNQIKVNPPRRFWIPWIIGNIIGFIPFIFLILARSLVVFFIWNLMLQQLGSLSFISAYSLVAIGTIVTMRYQLESQLESIIDLIIKLLLFSFVTFLFSLL
jgi:hypothetical protein